MRKMLPLLFCLFVFPVVGFTTPPVDISLSYDMDKGSLHVEAVHPSFNLDKSYVRLMNVYVNGSQVSSLNYFRQSDYNKFTDDVPLAAQVGDVIKVELFCTLGGEASKELTVTKPTQSQPDPSADPPVSAQSAGSPPAASQAQGALIRSIVMEGFVLEDKDQFAKLFKPYRNKYLTTADMDKILQKIQAIYEREGYLQLVVISYRVQARKHRLIFTASMTS